MNRYRSELLGNIRHARTQLITGLENPRLSPITKERMMSWISEAEDELIFRARQAGEIDSPAAEILRSPSVRDFRSGAGAATAVQWVARS